VIDSITPQLLQTIIGVRGGAGTALPVDPAALAVDATALSVERCSVRCIDFFGSAGAGAGVGSGAGTGSWVAGMSGGGGGGGKSAAGGALLQADSAPNNVASSNPWISRVRENLEVFIVGAPISKKVSDQFTAIGDGRKNRRVTCRQPTTHLRSCRK
jgi:hypothetical protein